MESSGRGLRAVIMPFLLGVVLVAVPTSASAQEWVPSPEELKNFKNETLVVIAACEGDPQIIPITADSPVGTVYDYFDHETVPVKTAWLENNCAFYLYPYEMNPDGTPVLPKETDELSILFPNSTTLRMLSLGAPDGVKPRDISTVLVETGYFCSDLNASGSFEIEEVLDTVDLSPKDLRWEYSEDEIHSLKYWAEFMRSGRYLEFDGDFKKVASFEGGPLDGRDLYFVVLRNEIR